ncbi:MAG: hypothetical protein HQL26_09350 [Candidatus Omnitrophica bacterium]|nr:hypothetical protein [Candidatus Omnitrophota bacterium]
MTANKSKTSFICSLALGLLGAIASLFFTIYLFVFSVFQLNQYFIHEQHWPIWVTIIMVMIYLAVAFSVISITVKAGARLGIILDGMVKSKIYKNLLVTVIVLLSAASFVLGVLRIFGLTSEPIQVEDAPVELSSIKYLNVNKTKEGLELRVGVTGPNKDKYRLDVDLSVSGDKAKGTIKHSSEIVPLTFPMQEFNVPVTSEELGSQYAKLLNAKDASFEEDQELTAQAVLTVISTEYNTAQEIEEYHIPPDRRDAVIKVTINCASGQCRVKD